MSYQLNKFYFSFIASSILLSVGCIPPANWKASPYLIARLPGSELKNKTKLRIMLYEGKALPVSSKSIFKFNSKSESKFYKGGDIVIPSGEGIIIAQNHILTFRGKDYHGRIKIVNLPQGFRYINQVTMPYYIMSVIGHEMNNSWPLESLKAQAIVSRSYAAVKIIASVEKDYDMDTTTKNQVYGGIPPKRDRLKKAVHATEGRLLVYNSELAKVFFHSSCGGRLEAAHELWKEKIPYLDVKESNFCKDAPNYRWRIDIPISKIMKLVNLTDIQKIEVSTRTASRRAKEILVASREKIVKLDPVKLRNFIGATKLKSYFFDIRLNGQKIEISGRGYGHGIGMCQWGSRIMAEKNKMLHEKILRHFFPGASITKVLGRGLI